MGLFSPGGFIRVLTSLVDRSLDGGADGRDAATDNEKPRSQTAKRGHPHLELGRESSHATPRGHAE